MAVVVLRYRSRRGLGARHGVLAFDGPSVALYDGTGMQLFSVLGSDLQVGTSGKRKILLRLGQAEGGETHMVEGPWAQLGRVKKVKDLAESLHAVVTPPRVTSMTDKQWAALTRSTSPYTLPFNRMTQQSIWRNVLLGLLWDRQARPAGWDNPAG